jgi:tetratricopeptide (TPR) repeat protein
MEALIAFSWYRCDTKPNLEIANHVVTAAKASRVERYIALAVWCLGQTHYGRGDLHSSYHHLQEAYQLFNTLPPGEVESQRLGGQCGVDLVDAARIALQYNNHRLVSLAREVERRCATLSDDLVHGRSLAILGAVLHDAQRLQEALPYLEHAKTMLEAVGNSPNLAVVCQVISWVHAKGGPPLTEALSAIEEAWKHAELTDSPSIQAIISLDLSRILSRVNRDTDAWKYMKISLMKASYTGNIFRVARALESMGYEYLRRGDYQNAYGAYEAAAEKFLGTVDAHVAKRCKDNMTRIKEKQENTDVVIGFHRPSIALDETLFYPPIQASASDMPIPVL